MPPVGTIGDREGAATEGAAMEGTVEDSATTRADNTFSNRPTFMLLKGGIPPFGKGFCVARTEVGDTRREAAVEGSATTRADSTSPNNPAFTLLKDGMPPIGKEVCDAKTEVRVTDGTAALCPKPRPFRTAGISP
jgi:hypothetical protein